jgi:putative phosphoesterase
VRIAVLSDIHGNLPALEAVYKDLKTRKPDGLIVAGDFVGGPHPDQTIALLRSLKPNWMILGNSDINILRYIDGQVPEAYRTAKQFALLRWGGNHISLESIDFLRDLPRQQVIALDGTASIRVVHGSLNNPYEGYDPEAKKEKFDFDFHLLDEMVLISGHTHCPWSVEWNGKLAINPGSVAGPLNGYVGTQYALIDWVGGQWKAQLYAQPYDISRICADFSESGLLDAGGALARCFLYSIETGEDVSRQFLQYAFLLAEQAGYSDCPVMPDEVWEKAEANFNWNRWNKTFN